VLDDGHDRLGGQAREEHQLLQLGEAVHIFRQKLDKVLKIVVYVHEIGGDTSCIYEPNRFDDDKKEN
jgi:hypothetical protein